MNAKSYRKLDVWKVAMDMVEAVYVMASELPTEERYGARSQLQRAAVSVPANIAEGYGRLHRGDYVHHLSIARGSLFEVETLIALLVRLKLVPRQQALVPWKECQRTGQMLHRLIASLRPPSPGTRNPGPGTR